MQIWGEILAITTINAKIYNRTKLESDRYEEDF